MFLSCYVPTPPKKKKQKKRKTKQFVLFEDIFSAGKNPHDICSQGSCFGGWVTQDCASLTMDDDIVHPPLCNECSLPPEPTTFLALQKKKKFFYQRTFL